jgi:hypothetical protein
MLETCGLCLYAGTTQRRRRCRWNVEHLEVGMKRREVKRNLGAEILHKPRTKQFDFFFRVIVTGDEECSDLEPDPGVLADPHERVEDWLHGRATCANYAGEPGPNVFRNSCA